MRFKLLTALVFSLLFTLIFSSQFALAHHEDEHEHGHDHMVTGPTTGPVTGPVTSPVSGPVTMFKITGKVTYHFLGILKNGWKRFMPAAGVKVKAEDIFNHHKVTTMTDSDGNYVLDPGQKGFYKVTVSGGETSFYVPPVRFINDKHGKDHVDFQGLIFKYHEDHGNHHDKD